MQKEKRLTLNAEKRKVIADVFQQHFEDNSKFKKAWQDAKQTYSDMRSIAKTKMDVLITRGRHGPRPHRRSRCG